MKISRLAAGLAGLLALGIAAGADAQMRGGGGFGGGNGGGMMGGRMGSGFGGGGQDGGNGEPSANAEVMGAFMPIRADIDAMRKRGFLPTGLEGVYPTDAKCRPIVSGFASRQRHDGTARSTKFYLGYHGGADIAAPPGTPLLAIADGKVIHKSEGPNIGGIGLMLQHAPADTGLKVWLYTEYKHLDQVSSLRVGQRVKMGDVVGHVGNTGTTGGRAYGEEGFYHLHWTAFFSDNPDYRIKRIVIPVHGQWMDPLAVFLRDPLDSHKIRDLPDARRKARIAYKRTDGRVVPDGARIIWPMACDPS